MLLRHSEGAIFCALVATMVAPIGSLWWSLFKIEPYFRWHPDFTITTVYVLASLFVMVPAIVLYNHFSIKDDKALAEQLLTTKGVGGRPQDYEQLD